VEFPDLLKHGELLEHLLLWLERHGVFSDDERLRLRSLPLMGGASDGQTAEGQSLEEIKGFVLKKK
jgi:hypothetical protein